MDYIKIIWLDSDRKERASFEMQAGDLEAASRIFAEMIKTLKTENSSSDPENLGPGSHEVERKPGS
ncbi:MAG TPA: hypothetical protein VJ046_02650 [Candidatus Paceibacterota bacterium]|nr:hypothetical protein [Candidatus Paceibacterota bacterium]